MAEPPPDAWPRWTRPYSIELRFQAAVAETAFQSLERRVAQRKGAAAELAAIMRDGGPLPLELERVAFGERVAAMGNMAPPILGDIQSFLAAVGVIESILWPSERHYRSERDCDTDDRVARGRAIRTLLGVSESSPLQTTSRGEDDARGGMLHFDEMIDSLARDGTTREYVSFEIGSAARGTDVNRARAIRWLDEDSLELWVAGRHRSLREVEHALRATVGRMQTHGELHWVRAPGPPSADPPPPSVSFGADIAPP